MALITIPDKSTSDTLTAAEFNQILDAIKDGTLDINTAELQIAGDVKTFPTGAVTLVDTSSAQTLSNKSGSNSQWTNDEGYITDYTVTEGDVTAHQAALVITESQISDLQSYLLPSDIGSTVQSWDAHLDDLAGLTPASRLIIGDGLGGWTTITPANFITDNNIIQSGDNVSSLTNDSGFITDYTVTEGDVTAHEAALTITESQISDLGTYLENVSEDTTPQLGGNLDVNGNSIVSTSNGNITLAPNGTGDVVLGNFTFDADQTVGAGQDDYVLTYNNSTGKISLEAATGGGGDAWSDPVDADIVPDGDNTRDLGSSSNSFADAYLTTIRGLLWRADSASDMAIESSSGNKILNLTYNDAVFDDNYVEISSQDNSSTGGPTIAAAGTDANISLNLVPKGTGEVQIDGERIIDETDVGSTVQAYDAFLDDISNLTDPGADRLLFWDDSAGDIVWLTAGTGLTISGTTITPRTASTTQTGIVELATTTETNTGTATNRAVTPDSLAGSYAGTKAVSLSIGSNGTDLATGDGQALIIMPPAVNGMNLVSVRAAVETAGTTGTTDIQVRNVTDSVDMLSTKLTIDSGETSSQTAATAAVINTSNDDVATGDVLAIDIDAVSTTAPTGPLTVTLEFRLP